VHFDCLVPLQDVPGDESPVVSPERALGALAGARFRLGALLASAQPLAAAVGNRAPRLVLVRGEREPGRYAELYELRGDRLRRLPGV
jgi:hypothetical protein